MKAFQQVEDPVRPVNLRPILVETAHGFSMLDTEELRQAAQLAARSPKLQFVGPRACPICQRPVVAAATEETVLVFDIPEGQIFPNTEWEVHLCIEPMPRRVSIEF